MWRSATCNISVFYHIFVFLYTRFFLDGTFLIHNFYIYPQTNVHTTGLTLPLTLFVEAMEKLKIITNLSPGNPNLSVTFCNFVNYFLLFPISSPPVFSNATPHLHPSLHCPALPEDKEEEGGRRK